MRHGGIAERSAGAELVPHRWDRSAARAGDLLRVDEPRQHATAVCGCSVHARASEATGFFAGVEWAAGRADFFCGLGISHYRDEPASVEEPGPGFDRRFLPAALRAHCAITAGAACGA